MLVHSVSFAIIPPLHFHSFAQYVDRKNIDDKTLVTEFLLLFILLRSCFLYQGDPYLLSIFGYHVQNGLYQRKYTRKYPFRQFIKMINAVLIITQRAQQQTLLITNNYLHVYSK